VKLFMSLGPLQTKLYPVNSLGRVWSGVGPGSKPVTGWSMVRSDLGPKRLATAALAPPGRDLSAGRCRTCASQLL